jgi:hypothetical protein
MAVRDALLQVSGTITRGCVVILATMDIVPIPLVDTVKESSI